ncbi:hypothetical protein A2U01_0024082 [Trifolium medium]|uniref:Uncharacterized protein n=1 Tax=Trifolium medium TaxID=97028 RepID=A0A392NT58_9FABA|nr:hypothetical protein [Trifolium medium]
MGFMLPTCFGKRGFLEKYPPKEINFDKVRARNEKLEAEVLKLESELIDHRGKHEVYVSQMAELRETQVELRKVEQEFEELKSSSAAEKKRFEDEIGELKLAVAPAADEPETARGLTTRVELVEVIKSLGKKVLGEVKYGFENAVAQLKIANPRIELNTEGTGMLRKVENGQIVIPEKYRHMEMEEDDEEVEEDDNPEEDHEEGHDESSRTNA